MIITLLDDREIPQAGITLDTTNQRFYVNATGEDITRLIPIGSKRLFAGFDATLYNELLYQEMHPDAPQVGSTSVTGNFLHQIFTDPLAAPADEAAKLTESIHQTIKSPVTWAIAAAAIVVLIIVLIPRRP